MSEGLVGEAKWEDVDKGTFVRFAQFVYIGDYTTPKMIVEPSAFPATVDEKLPPEVYYLSDEFNFRASEKKGGKKRIPGSRTDVFKALSYPFSTPRFNFADTCDPTIGDGPSENIGEILLIHASLYVLAEKWGIDRLKRLTLFKIHKTLCLFSLDTPKVEHVIQFVRYAYSDERTPDLETSLDLNEPGSSRTSPSRFPRMFVEYQPLTPSWRLRRTGATTVLSKVWPVLKSLPQIGVAIS